MIERTYGELQSLKNDLLTKKAYIDTLHSIIKSDSVYTLLRHGSKNPTGSGVGDCEDYFYLDLYKLSCNLRKKTV